MSVMDRGVMRVGKRFLIWSLVGIFSAVGFSGTGLMGRGVAAETPTGADTPTAIATPATKSPDRLPNLLKNEPPATNETDDVGQPESDAATGTESEQDSQSDILNPDPDPATEPESTPDAQDGTLTLPDFEPRLPGDSLPDGVSADDEDPWSDQDVEAADQEAGKLSKRQQILITADEYYLAGDRDRAEVLYRQVKDSVWQIDPDSLRPTPIYDPDNLPPAGAVYWREAQAGYAQGLTHRTLVPLELLVEEYPEFIPAQVFYADYLIENGQAEEADAVLDRALMVYPSQPDLLKARTEVQMAMEQWIEAAITAKQFALLNPDHPEHEAMNTLSQENLDRFRGEMNQNLTQNLIGNVLTGAAGLILTGGLIGPYTAINSAMILLQGESAVGANVAEQAKDQLPIMSDREINEYVNSMGQELAALAGRDEFDYAFYVIDDPDLNAFALPGGKIFINSGAILKTNSEAELAGLLAHEISHAVLSHGFQMATNGNLINSIAGVFPVPEVGGIAAGLAFSSYSRQMERQADVLGTQLLAAAGYAADGLHNLMVTLEAESDGGGIRWFASHPAPAERVDYLKQIVEVGGFNRYAYEGVKPHLEIQQRVERVMDTSEADE